MNNIIFFGPPGAGKGTQAKIVSENLNLSHLSTGEILRKKTLENDPLAIKLKGIMSSGKLVSDDILNKIVSSRLKSETKNGFILDGYPRTLPQADYFNNFLKITSNKIDYIFDIEISFSSLKDRILKRSSEESRDDDNIEVLETRYSEYIKTTKPVSDMYRESSPAIFYKIDGSLQIVKITEKITQIIKKSWKTAKFLYICPWLIM